jgi:hypothetical protein
MKEAPVELQNALQPFSQHRLINQESRRIYSLAIDFFFFGRGTFVALRRRG